VPNRLAALAITAVIMQLFAGRRLPAEPWARSNA
jgi:hypothetical protein